MQQCVPASSSVFPLLVLVYWEMRQHLRLDPSAHAKEGRSPKVHCSVIDGPCSCSPLMMKGSSLHKLKMLPSAPWSGRVDHISSAVPNRSPSSPARAGSWAWKQFVWTCSASFGCTWDFGICLACMLKRFKWQIMNRCLGEKDMEK